MVSPSFYGVIVLLYGDIMNPILCITLMIFFKSLPRDLCDILEFIAIAKKTKYNRFNVYYKIPISALDESDIF